MAVFPCATAAAESAAADVVVRLGEGLPEMPGRRQITWDIADPHHRSVDDVRAIREDIEQHVLDLLDELGFTPEGDDPDAYRDEVMARTKAMGVMAAPRVLEREWDGTICNLLVQCKPRFLPMLGAATLSVHGARHGRRVGQP